MAEVKPYTQEEREAIIAKALWHPVWDERSEESDARWLATLAAVEKERERAASYWQGEFTEQSKRANAAEIALAASQATVKELREKFAVIIANRAGDGGPCGGECGGRCSECVARVALASIDNMGASEQ